MCMLRARTLTLIPAGSIRVRTRRQTTCRISAPLHGSLRTPPLRPPNSKTPYTHTNTLPSVSVNPDCISKFNELKLGKDIKWIIYKISDDWKEIVVEETSNEANFDVFRDKLLDAKSKDRKGKEGIGGRYAVYDVEYDLPGGEGTRSKITFISWCPDDAPQYVSLNLLLGRSRRGECGGTGGCERWADNTQ